MLAVPSPQSEMGKELAKWERKPDWRASANPYPAMVYRALRLEGRWTVGEVDDRKFGGAPGAAESWSRNCYKTVNDETEHRRAKADGWSDTPKEALEHAKGEYREVGNVAAMRAHEDRNMSDAAKAELAEVEASTPDHVAEVVETPIRRRGRPRKVQPEA